MGNETYSIVSATEVNADLIKAEYFILIQRPNSAVYCGAIEFKKKVFPVELEKWSISDALDKAQLQVKIEVENLLEARASELNRIDLAYLTFEFRSVGDSSLMGAWTRGLFESQIRDILSKTESPKLRLYLKCLVQNPQIIR